MNSLELMKSSEVRKAGDWSNYYNIFFFADYIHTECFCDCELQILGNNIQNSESAGGHHF